MDRVEESRRQPRVLPSRATTLHGCNALCADAQLDAAAVPALLGAPAAVRRLGSAERRERLAALVGRQVIASLYALAGDDAAVLIAAVRLLDTGAPPLFSSSTIAGSIGA